MQVLPMKAKVMLSENLLIHEKLTAISIDKHLPQQRRNLVFGTKNCNTYMMRAENALQEFLGVLTNLRPEDVLIVRAEADGDHPNATTKAGLTGTWRDLMLPPGKGTLTTTVLRNHQLFQRLELDGSDPEWSIPPNNPPFWSTNVVADPAAAFTSGWFAPGLQYHVMYNVRPKYVTCLPDH
jgi:hypothetical protein